MSFNLCTQGFTLFNDSCVFAVEFNIPDQQPTHPVVKVKFGKDATPMENQQLSVIAERYCMIIIMCEWMCGWMCEWMCGWMCEWMCGWICECTWMCGWMCEWICVWMCGFVSVRGCVGGCVSGYVCGCVICECTWMCGWMCEWICVWMCGCIIMCVEIAYVSV